MFSRCLRTCLFDPKSDVICLISPVICVVRLPPSLSQVLIDVELLGFIYHWGLEVNSLTVIGELAVSLLEARGTK